VLVILILASARLGIDIPRCGGVNARLFDIGLDHPGITPRSWHGHPPLRGEGSLSQSAGTRHSHLVTCWCGWLSWVVILGQEHPWRRSQVLAVVPHCEGKAQWPGERPKPFVHPLVQLAVACYGLGQKSPWRRSQVVEVILHYVLRRLGPVPGERPQPFVHPLVRLVVVCCDFGPGTFLASVPSRRGRLPRLWRKDSVAWSAATALHSPARAVGRRVL